MDSTNRLLHATTVASGQLAMVIAMETFEPMPLWGVKGETMCLLHDPGLIIRPDTAQYRVAPVADGEDEFGSGFRTTSIGAARSYYDARVQSKRADWDSYATMVSQMEAKVRAVGEA